jgi:three-Cys-motif partner protein
MPNRETIWSLQPHTGAKHFIFRRHLEAWFPKLSWTGHVQVIDGFAGPGEYTGGEPGSPLIALNVARTHRSDLSNCQIDFVFVEEDLEVFVLTETAFRETHFKSQILRPMERAKELDVIRTLSPKRRFGAYPPGTVIRFAGRLF